MQSKPFIPKCMDTLSLKIILLEKDKSTNMSLVDTQEIGYLTWSLPNSRMNKICHANSPVEVQEKTKRRFLNGKLLKM